MGAKGALRTLRDGEAAEQQRVGDEQEGGHIAQHRRAADGADRAEDADARLVDERQDHEVEEEPARSSENYCFAIWERHAVS